MLEGGRQCWLLTLHSSPLKWSPSSEMPPLGSLGGLDDTPHGVLRSTCAEYQTHILCRWSSPRKRRGRWGSGDLERPRPGQIRPGEHNGVCPECSEDQLCQMASPCSLFAPPPQQDRLS